MSTDENLSYSHPPPFSNFISESSPPPDDQPVVETKCDKSESPTKCDVAKEKESCEIDCVVSQHQVVQVASYDNKLHAVSTYSSDNELVIEHSEVPPMSDEIDDEKTFINTSAVCSFEEDVDIPCIKEFTAESDLQSNDDENRDETISIEDRKPEPEDDEFKEFVEASPSETHVEPSDAFKSKEILGKISDNSEEFVTFSSPDIPEPIPELKLDDDDGDFSDFETAIPANRLIEQGQSFAINKEEIEAPVEFQFEADFSAFNAFSEPANESSSFDEFQDFKASGFDNSIKDLKNQLEEDDDDDFGDFSDFTQASAAIAIEPTAHSEPVPFVKPENVTGIVDMMFPTTPSSSFHEKTEALDGDYTSEQQVIKSDNFVNKFNDFDSTLALGYLYNNSKASQTLVKALGIDTRNIVSIDESF